MAIPSSLSLVQLHSGQMKVFQSPHRFKVVCAGRRWGKSRLSISTIIRAAAKEKKAKGLVCRSYLPDGSPDFVGRSTGSSAS